MNGIERQHQGMVKDLVKPGAEILKTLTPEKADLWHAASGIATEALELLDAVKAHVVYGKPLDIDNVREEAGDLEFYQEQFRTNPLVNLTRSHILEGNYNKLSKRYLGLKYSDAAAQAREDKKTGETDNS